MIHRRGQLHVLPLGAIVLLLVITGEARVLLAIFEFFRNRQLVVAPRRYTVIVTIVKLKLALNTN